MDDTDPAVREAFSKLSAAHYGLIQAIAALDDPQTKFDRASEASETLLKMRGEMADLRTQSAGEIWEREQLSLAKLANRIGVSKARADEMIRAVKSRRSSNG